MKFRIFVAAAMLAGSSAVVAQEAEQREDEQAAAVQAAATQNQEADNAEEEDPGEEIVCRRERITGSLTRVRRTCMTRNEWNNVEARTRDEMNRMGRRASGGVECRQDQFGGC